MKKHRTKDKTRRQRIPKKEKIAAIIVNEKSKTVMVVTKDMLTNQIYRDGPRIAATFDGLARGPIRECSEVMSMAQVMLIKHLPEIEDNGSRATCARLLFSAAHSYVAAIEVARKGYPREFGALMRLIVETIATVLTIAIDGGPTLEKFHQGKLETTRCIGTAKKALPFIGRLNGELSNNFVHIGELKNSIDGATPYKIGDQRLDFVITMMKFMALLLDIVTEVIFSDDIENHRYWKKEGKGWKFEPTKETQEWMEKFAPQTKVQPPDESATVPNAPPT